MNGKARGFTLIELMITISIAAILLGVGVPSMSNMIVNNQRAAVVNELISGLRTGRSAAFTRNVIVRTCVSNNADNPTACDAGGTWTDGWFTFTDTDNDNTLDIGETILYQQGAAPESVASVGSSGVNFRVTRRTGTPGTIRLQAGGKDRCIIVNPAGGTRLDTTPGC